MNSDEFRDFSTAATEFIIDYLKNIRERDVLSSVTPGYLHNLLPNEAPEQPDNWKNVLDDLHEYILPGLTHWQSPYFHAYYPTTTSYPSMVAEFITAGISVLSFSWICSPAATELEAIVSDWVAKFINIPKKFLNATEGPGGGSFHNSASDTILVCVIAAREKNLKLWEKRFPEMSQYDILSKFIGYSSDQSNSSIEKAGLLAGIPIRLLEPNENYQLNGTILIKAIRNDLSDGKIPIICIATCGTTGLGAFDNLIELGPICNQYNIWLHIDAAYAGISNSLPEFNFPHKDGFEYAQSFNYNLPKSMLVNYDCCGLWLENASDVSDNFNVDRIYLKHCYETESTMAPDYRNWQLALGRRFRALKVWIVMRLIGLEGIRNYVRTTYELAEYFEQLICCDDRFELIGTRKTGLVCFRIKNNNKLTKKLLEYLMRRKKVYLIEASYKDKTYLRFVVGGNDPQSRDIEVSWNEIRECTDLILREEVNYSTITISPTISFKDANEQNDAIIDEISKNLQSHCNIK